MGLPFGEPAELYGELKLLGHGHHGAVFRAQPHAASTVALLTQGKAVALKQLRLPHGAPKVTQPTDRQEEQNLADRS